MRTKTTSGFVCLECGRKFRTTGAAERAASVGYPKCGSVDVDLDPQGTLAGMLVGSLHAAETAERFAAAGRGA